MNKLHNLILAAIKNHGSPLWFPELTEDLVNYGWQQLYEKNGLQAANYSTEAVLNDGIDHSPMSLIISVKPSVKALPAFNIYPMPDKVATLYADSGTKPYTTEILQNSTILQCLQEAFDILAEISTVYETVSHLVASLHILQPDDDDFDISYSLPNIPFSIFVSVPNKRMNNDAVRVAEGILHEAMHLQLTLIEQCMPLIVETDEKYFSPWKNEYRHPRGVLHAIYVFCVIKQFFGFLSERKIAKQCNQYLTSRCEVILSQLAEIDGFLNCSHLTQDGYYFSNLLKNIT